MLGDQRFDTWSIAGGNKTHMGRQTEPLALYDGALDEGIPIIDVRHEQAAVHAADAYSRLNPGRIGCAVLTAGPGVTDGVTGIANAWRANSPVLVIGGQAPFNSLRRGSLQEMDHVSMVRPISKWADSCYQTDRIPEYIEMAVRAAVSGVPGPAFLEIPMDVLMGPASLEEAHFPTVRTTPPMVVPDPDDVRAAVDALAGAERPILLAGTGVKWSQGGPALTRFVQATRIPTFLNGMGRGMLRAEIDRVVGDHFVAGGGRFFKMHGVAHEQIQLPL